MTSIFTNALRAVKSNPDSEAKSVKVNRNFDGPRGGKDSGSSGSILDRIKLNKTQQKTIKTINIRKNYSEEDDDDRFASENIQRKVIKKDISSLKHPASKSSLEGMWKHDMYTGPAAVTTTRPATAVVFVRNVPEMVSGQHLKEILRNPEAVTGIRMDNGTAEINFSKSEAAKRAVEDLNGKQLRGKTLKAAIVGDINTNSLDKPSSKLISTREESKEDSFRSSRVQPKPKMHIDNNDDKSSILNRIKKAR